MMMFRRIGVCSSPAVGLWSTGSKRFVTTAFFLRPSTATTASMARYSTPLIYSNLISTRSFAAPASNKDKDGIVRNEDIRAEKMRVVYKDPETNKSSHEVLSRLDALKLAKKLDLDLILIDAQSDPPVCKLEKYGQVLQDQKKKEKAQRANQKAHVLKEMMINLGIDKHDFDTKMNKVKSFLDEGNQVKVNLFSKKKPFYKSQIEKLQRNTVATSMSDLDEVTLHLFTSLEDMPVMVQQHDFHNDVPCPPHVEGAYYTATGTTMVKVHHRREFLVMPKGAAKTAPVVGKKEKGGKEKIAGGADLTSAAK